MAGVCAQLNCETNILEKWLTQLVLADGNQSLAAKPGFHGDPPQRAGFGMTAVRRSSDHPPKPCRPQPKIDLAGELPVDPGPHFTKLKPCPVCLKTKSSDRNSHEN